MKKITIFILALLILPTLASAQLRVFTVPQGGTGASTLTGCLTGNGTSAITGSGTCATFAWPFLKLSTNEQATSTTLLFTNGIITTASSTLNVVKLTNLTSNGVVRTSGSDGTLSVDTSSYATFNWPFTKQADNSQATSTLLSLFGGVFSNASSTIGGGTTGTGLTILGGATTTELLVTGSSTLQTTALTAIRNLSSNGFVKTSGGAGTLSVDTNTYLTGMTFAWPWTKLSTNEQATSTTILFSGANSFIATASSTLASTTVTSLLANNATSTDLHVSNIASTTQIRANTGIIGRLTSLLGDFVDATFSGHASSTGNLFAGGNINFNGELLPDGLTCSNGEILKKTGANDWDCATDSVGTALPWPFTKLGTNEQATSTTLAFLNGFLSTASSSASSLVATSTNLNVSANHISFGSNYISATSTAAFRVASSTLDASGASFNRATTTLHLANFTERVIVRSVSCTATSTGGVLFHVGDGTNFSAGVFCDNLRKQTVLNYTLEPFEDFTVMVGKASSTPQSATLTFTLNKLSD